MTRARIPPREPEVSHQAQAQQTAKWVSTRSPQTASGNLVLLVTGEGKRYLLRLQTGQRFHSHLGWLLHDDLIGQAWGTAVHTQLGHTMILLEPALTDLMTRIKRGTQIIYPKDAAYLIHTISLRSGSHVIEAGTGSGSLSIALAWAVAPQGMVYTYEHRPEIFQIARGNLERTGLLPYVRMHQESIDHGFRQQGADAVVLDVRQPWDFLAHVCAALRPGGFFASLLPTTNQVTALLEALEQHGFTSISVEELLVRSYKPVPDRLRPDDEMVGHTGYLVFARLVHDSEDPSRWLSEERRRYEARKAGQARIEAEEQRRASERAQGGPRYPRLPLPG